MYNIASGLESGLPWAWWLWIPFSILPWGLWEALNALSIVWVFDWTSVDDTGITPDPAKKKVDDGANSTGEETLAE